MWFSMLVAHWCYFGAGIISMIFMREKGELCFCHVDDKGTVWHPVDIKISILHANHLSHTGEVVASNLDSVHKLQEMKSVRWSHRDLEDP